VPIVQLNEGLPVALSRPLYQLGFIDCGHRVSLRGNTIRKWKPARLPPTTHGILKDHMGPQAPQVITPASHIRGANYSVTLARREEGYQLKKLIGLLVSPPDPRGIPMPVTRT